MSRPARWAHENAQRLRPGAVVIERGPGFIRHRVPGTNTEIYQVGIGNRGWHLPDGTEIDTAWLPDSGVWQWQMTQAEYEARAKDSFNGAPLLEYRVISDWVTLQPRQLNWTNDRGDVQVAGTVQNVAATLAEDDKLLWTGAFGAGRDFKGWLDTRRVAKQLILASYDSFPAPTTQVLTGGNPVLQLQFQFDYSNSLTVFVNGQAWANNRPTLTTGGEIEFRNAGGDVICAFHAPQAWGQDETRPATLVQRIGKSGNNLLVEVRVSQDWLANAIYPVIIDPTLGPTAVAASADDAGEDEAGNVTTDGNPLANLDNSSRRNGVRFPVDLTASSITSAKITAQFTGSTLDEPDITIYGEDAATPAAFSASANNISNRTSTTASADYANTNQGANSDFDMTGLEGIISELYTSYGPYSSGYIGFLMMSRAGDATRDTSFKSYDGSTSVCMRLTVVYESSSNQTVNLSSVTLAGSVPTADAQPGAISVTLSALTLAGSVVAMTVTPVTSITMNTITLAGSVPALTVQPGAVSLTMNTLTLAGSAVALTVSAGGEAQQVTLSALTLAGSVPVMDVQPGAVSVTLSALTLAGSVVSLSANPGAVSVVLNTLILAGSVPSGTVNPGAVSIVLNALTLAGSVPSLGVTVPIPQTVTLSTLILAAVVASLTGRAELASGLLWWLYRRRREGR